eukprot:6211982-Pleurochrysis_carterae.AAC.5
MAVATQVATKQRETSTSGVKQPAPESTEDEKQLMKLKKPSTRPGGNSSTADELSPSMSPASSCSCSPEERGCWDKSKPTGRELRLEIELRFAEQALSEAEERHERELAQARREVNVKNAEMLELSLWTEYVEDTRTEAQHAALSAHRQADALQSHLEQARVEWVEDMHEMQRAEEEVEEARDALQAAYIELQRACHEGALNTRAHIDRLQAELHDALNDADAERRMRVAADRRVRALEAALKTKLGSLGGRFEPDACRFTHYAAPGIVSSTRLPE